MTIQEVISIPEVTAYGETLADLVDMFAEANPTALAGEVLIIASIVAGFGVMRAGPTYISAMCKNPDFNLNETFFTIVDEVAGLLARRSA